MGRHRCQKTPLELMTLTDQLEWVLNHYPKIKDPVNEFDLFQNNVHDILKNAVGTIRSQNDLINLLQDRLIK